jgi:hypothetical protein
MKNQISFGKSPVFLLTSLLAGSICWLFAWAAPAQTLLNVDFGAGKQSAKTGVAAGGRGAQDFWNLYSHYDPRYVPGMPLVTNGALENLKLSDGSPSAISLTLSNAPGVWGNTTGDAMMDGYVFGPNGGTLVLTLQNLGTGRYQFYLYGHGDPDVLPEQCSLFRLRSGTNDLGPLATLGSARWQTGMPWQEGRQYVVFRDVGVASNQPVVIEITPGAGGYAVLNGLQIWNRGTSPTDLFAVNPVSLGDVATNLMVREVRYAGKIATNSARFSAQVTVESLSTNELTIPLFQGALAASAVNLPSGLRLASNGHEYYLTANVPGLYTFTVDLEAKVLPGETWRSVLFYGPTAVSASIEAEANDPNLQVQLLSGFPWKEEKTNALSFARGVIGADRLISLRWRNQAAEAERKSFATAETSAEVNCTPVVIKYDTKIQYDILQAPLPRLTIALPENQALTQIQGDQIRDWRVESLDGRPTLTVEFLKPVEKSYTLAIHTEQTLDAAEAAIALALPQPLGVERESGLLVLRTEEVQVELGKTPGLLQANPPEGALAAFRFNLRPFQIAAKIKKTEAEITVRDRLGLQVEESRLVASHTLQITVAKAGIYGLNLRPQSGFEVVKVKGDGVEDWRFAEGRLVINFAAKLLDTRAIEVQLERVLPVFPETIPLEPLRVVGAKQETAQIGVSAAAGIRLKTGESTGLREVPVSELRPQANETLAYTAPQADWRVVLAAERPSARVVAEVFNLISIGDGMLGGSATLRFSILNQGMRRFRIQLPAMWKNVEFTGAGIRGKELTNEVWTITLQDKAWDAYTLVISYDAAFDPKGARLNLDGAHPLEVERETGELAVTAAPGLELKPATISEALRRIDESELPAADRALLTRPVLLAYRYNGHRFELTLDVNRFEQTRLLDAVADRTELVTVLTEAGQMLTQASFMVKNNEKQFQRFRLPEGAEFWSCRVNSQPVKTEQDGAWLLVPLPRGANRNQVFAVEMVYAHKTEALPKGKPRHIRLAAPQTDVPNTYVEWQWYAPKDRRLSGFGGSMTVDRDETYDVHEAWKQTLSFYGRLIQHEPGLVLALTGVIFVAVITLVFALRRGWRGLVTALVLAGVTGVLGLLLLPAASTSKRKAAYEMERLGEPQGMLSGQIAPAAAPVPVDKSMVVAGVDGAVEQKAAMSGAMMRRYGLVPESKVIARAIGVTNAGPVLPALNVPAGGAPMAAGIRPIHIEIPKEGRAYRFTKVLNVADEPLTIEAKVSERDAFQAGQSILESLGFLLGVVLVWWPRRSRQRQSFKSALGVLLILLAGGHWLAMRSLLHYALILGLPLLAMLLFVAVLWRCVPRRAIVVPVAVAMTAFCLVSPAHAGEAMLLSASKAERPKPVVADALPAGISILATHITGETRRDTARLEVEIALTATLTNQLVKLFDNNVAVQDFAPSTQARLVRLDTGYYARLSEPGSHLLRMKLLVKLANAASGKQMGFALPPALRSDFTLTLDEPEAEVEFPGAISFQTTAVERQTRIEAVLGTEGRVDLRWTPRVKRAGEVAATVFCENTTGLQLTPNGAQIRAVLNYQVSQGELWRSRVALPPNHRLVRVTGPAIRTWNVRPAGTNDTRAGAQELVVEYVKGMPPQFQLIVETEMPVTALPSVFAAEIPRALDAKRETGYLAVRAGEELAVALESKELRRLDAGDFEKLSGQKMVNAIGTYRFMRAGFDLRVAMEQAKPQIEATVLNAFAVGLEDTRLEVAIQYRVKKLGVFLLQTTLPAGFQVEKVTGEKILQWTQNQGVLEVSLAERSGNRYSLHLSLTRAYKPAPDTLELAGAIPIGTEKTTGFVTVAARLGLALKLASRVGLNEIPPTAVEMDTPGAPAESLAPTAGVAEAAMSGMLAFKQSSSDPWKLTLGMERIAPWIRTETATTIHLGETVASGRTAIRFEVANAPAREFRLRVPSACANVEINGADIRVRDHQTNDWRVELQNPVAGYYQLVVTWEIPRATVTNLFEYAGAEVLGVERETGYLAIFAKPPIQAMEQTAADLARVDGREWPDWAGGAPEAAVLAYRYLRPGSRLQLTVQRYDEAAVLQALVDQAELITVVADNGQTMTEMRLSVRNNGRQFLSMEMPPGARVWSALVAGQAVRPCWREGQLLLPLERAAKGGEAVAVELVWISTNVFPSARGAWAISSPKLDVPWKNAAWKLYLPLDYHYSEFQGTMSVASPEASPAVALYSLADYRSVETQRDDALSSEARSSLSLARRQLTEGKVEEAVSNFRLLKRKIGDSVGDGVVELKQFEGDLGRVQANNMLQAQNEFSARNGGQAQQLTGDSFGNFVVPQGKSQAYYFNWDASVAGRQALIVQKAQEFALAPLQPLRVNLPTRGMLFTFKQALQTELQKPLTIQLVAENDKTAGWRTGVLLVATVFAALWLLLAVWPKQAASQP